MLILQRKPGESLQIGEQITVSVISVEEAAPAELLGLLGGMPAPTDKNTRKGGAQDDE